MTRGGLFASSAIAVALAFPAVASSATIVVDTTDDDPISEGNDTDCTLREAVEAANTNASIDDCTSGDPTSTNPDTIELPITGSYLLDITTDEDLNDNGDLDVQASTATGGPLTIDGTAAGVVIDAQGMDRVIHHLSGNLELSDLTVTGGARFTGNGGGILGVGGDLSLTDVTVTDSSTAFGERGGGIYFAPSSAASLTVTDSTISDNLVGADPAFSGNLGGGIAVGPNGDLDMSDSSVTGNDIVENGVDGSNHGGGGIWAGGSPPEITGSTISGNTVTVGPSASTVSIPNGGGVMFDGTGGGRIADSTISGNGLVDSNPSAALSPSGAGVTFTSTGAAGPVYSVVNSTIASNTVSGDGTGAWGGALSALLASGHTVRVTHATLTANSAPAGAADAVAAAGGTTTVFLKNSIFDDPDATHTDTCVTSSVTLTSAGHNVAEGTSCVDNTVNATDVDETDPALETLGDFGGPTETAPPQTTSPAVDLVPHPTDCNDGEATPAPLTEDQRGFPRPFDGDSDSDADCDAGAVEVYPCLGENATIVNGISAIVNGTAGDDVIRGIAASGQQLRGGSGNDKLCGGIGGDTLRGSAGDDGLDGGPGSDAGDYRDATGSVSASVTSAPSDGLGGADTLTNVENLDGGPMADSLSGDANANLLFGQDGDDNLSGLGGDDDYFGGNGDDLASFELAPLTGVTANLVTDVASGDGGLAEPLNSIEDLTGSDGPDDFTGGPEANAITGQLGGDEIDPGGGADVVDAGDGADQLLIRDGVADQANCGTGGAPDSDVDTVTADPQGTDVLINCLAPDVVSFPAGPAPTGACAGKSATVAGTNAAEVLTGTPAADVIDAKGGNDTVRSLGGNDLVCGVAGNDKLIGGGGRDKLIGGAGKDTLKGGPGRDKLLGKGGRDRCIGGAGRDRGRGCEIRRTL